MSCSENTDSTDCDWDFPITQENEIARLRAALAEADKDARRWREEGYACSNFVRRVSKGQVYTATEATEYLSAIDAAMEREEG